jgi:hypothetical protein
MTNGNRRSGVRDILGRQRSIEIESTTRWQLESEDIIRNITRALGWDYKLIEDGESIKMVTFKMAENPTINETGIISIIQSLHKIVNKNTFLSHIKDSETTEILVDHMESVLDDLAMNFDTYGMDSIATLDKAFSTVYNMSEIALYRGREGATMDYLKTVIKSIERLVTSQQDEKKGKGRIV